MKKQPLGCLSVTGIIALLITLAFFCGSYVYWGGAIFTPGDLNAQVGAPLGGVSSHMETKGDCAACHSAPWSQESMAMRCISCHEETRGQLQNLQDLHGYVIDANNTIVCRDCHTEHIGADSLITFQGGPTYPHKLFGYSIIGHKLIKAGESFECDDCHSGDITQFSLTTCTTCHLEFEADYIKEHELLFGQDCLACHDGLDTYAYPFDHDNTDFPLLGEHANFACIDCHQNARSRIDLQQTSSQCVDCHSQDNPHSEQLGTNCGACHSPVGWDQVLIDHNLTAFPLIGLHAEVACESCHVNDVYIGTPQTCVDCHLKDDIHAGAFGADCAKCHVEDGWELATFDHDPSLSLNCASCHSIDKPSGHYPGQCSNCHSTDTWQGATFSHTFPINHEGAKGVCSKCHTSNNYSTYTCYNCHNKSKIQKKHRKEGISNYQNCVRCHWDGREHD